MKYRVLTVGDPAPWVSFPTPSMDLARIDLMAGRYVVLCFFGSSSAPGAMETLAVVRRHRQIFDDSRASFFGVTIDPADAARMRDNLPGIRFGLDGSRDASIAYGVVSPEEGLDVAAPSVRQMWVVLDPTLRLLHVEPFGQQPADAASRVMAYLEGLPPPARHAGFPVQAPVLILPNVFEPAFCSTLITCYRSGQPQPSGFMDEVEGKTVRREDITFKSRTDVSIPDPALREDALGRIQRRVVPEIRKVFQFEASRMERYLIARYAAGEGGRFGPHRDNSTRGTQHRRFAVSVLLNDAFEGGELHFPEYGSAPFRVSPGTAIVFSCTLMHEVLPVRAGERYAFLPFLYDETAAAVREANNPHLGDGIAAYDPNLG
jgi:peroxiredoxin